MERRDQAWIEPMVTAFSRPAFQLAAALVKDRAVAEEIVQEAFMRALSNRRTPRELPEFRRWFYRIVVNLTREHHRRSARARRLAVMPQPLPDPEDEAERRMGDLEMAAALQLLTDREREAVYLRFFQDLAFDDVAAAMGINESTARVLVHRGLQRLRDRLAKTSQKRETS
jgi:RNA polymerase sigma-70 factor (ECF subfamily)